MSRRHFVSMGGVGRRRSDVGRGQVADPHGRRRVTIQLVSVPARRGVGRPRARRRGAVDAAGARSARGRWHAPRGRSRSSGRWPRTSACAAWWPGARRSPGPRRATACTSRWRACGRAASTSTASRAARSRARPAGRGPRRRPAPTPPVRFAFASCQHYEHGHYTAYRHMAEEDLDLVLHLGDYIYEFGPRPTRRPAGVARTYTTAEPTDACRLPRPLRRSTSTTPTSRPPTTPRPWVVTWDDHEVQDNYAGLTCGQADPAAFRARRAAAYQAYWEHMPLRRSVAPRPRRDAHLPPPRLRPPGALQRAGHPPVPRRPGAGGHDGVARRRPVGARRGPGALAARTAWPDSPARWNVVAQQIFFARRDSNPGPGRDVQPTPGTATRPPARG